MFAAMPDYDMDSSRLKPLRREYHVFQQWFAAYGMQHFGQAGFHTRSLTGGEDHDFQFHDNVFPFLCKLEKIGVGAGGGIRVNIMRCAFASANRRSVKRVSTDIKNPEIIGV
jgi:hypothetical protein